MLCYVGKATKIFFFVIASVAAVALFIGLGLLRHGAAHKARGPVQCQGGDGGGDTPCNTIASFPDPATAATVPPPAGYLPVGPTNTVVSPPSPPIYFPAGPTAAVLPPPSFPDSPAGGAAPVPVPTTAAPPVVGGPLDLVPPTVAVTAPPPFVAMPGPGLGALN